ncbi:MAG TPA: hypothetical protein ENH62_07040 [Marinobacter sp.]|uniref:Uncharacterized protein n=1 Tax=marine sediment metagenome TaxID=412755 RepID=A0A0F9PRX7_9ZZZZ|nr:hypothetical protein [Marinobacter sp.]
MLLRLLVFTLAIIGMACSTQSLQVHAQESNAASIDLTGDAIEAAILSDGAIWLKLTPSGSNQMATTTRDNLGNRVMVHVLGHKALSLMVVHEIVSDRLVIKSPSQDLDKAIEPYLVETR